ncbi:MAG: prefoldin subunit 3 [Candidatus Micrarchaeota archaeon]|nr:prefoldin subunit 3 [Candidatus Micrarchaeota archaeon]
MSKISEPKKSSESDMELQQKVNSLLATAQYLQTQQQLLANQMQLLTSAILRIDYMLKTINTYGNNNIRFANIGNNIYVPYKMDEEFQMGLVIELGAEYYAYVQKSYAIEYLQQRKSKLEQNLEKAKTLADTIQQKISEVNEEAERIVRLGKGNVPRR